MKTLHFYLLRQVLATLVMTVAVFMFILLVGSVMKELVTLLVNRQVSFQTVTEATLLLIPYVLAFALPMGMLTATLLVFGRFSAEQELTAARASGISLLSLAAPVVGLSLLLCGVSAVVNLQIAPQCRAAYKQLLFQLGIQQPNLFLPEGQFVTGFRDCIFYVGKNDGKNLKDVMVYLMPDKTNIFMKIHAPRGTFDVDVVSRKVEVHLFEARSVTVTEGRWLPQFLGEWTHSLEMSDASKAGQAIRVQEMTFFQLRRELANVEKRIAASSYFQTARLPAAQDSEKPLRRQREELTMPIRVFMNRQVGFSFACFGFTLIGIPLAIRVQRRETNIGFAIALGLVLVYYSFVTLSQALVGHPELSPHLIVWLPNLLFQVVGGILLWRANRGI